MAEKIKSIRGMNDILPPDSSDWQVLEQLLRDICHAYSYQEIRTPFVESTHLFQRSLGEVTDVVEKEMYTFSDRNGDSLTLRPEATAGCVRAGIEHGLFYNQLQRWWYAGPIFRHERPQLGRYRQFNQLGVEAFGMAEPAIDAEVILLSARLLKALGLYAHVELQINNIGSLEARLRYQDVLKQYWGSHLEQLDEDSARRYQTNPLRLFDSKQACMQDLIKNAPPFADYLDDDSKSHVAQVCDYLQASGISYVWNDKLVRGLDYYNATVFEWVTHELGAQGTVCAGGRYDNLVSQLGEKRPVPAVGFAAGMERLLILRKEVQQQEARSLVDVYLLSAESKHHAQALKVAEVLRDKHRELKVQVDCTGNGLKSQLKRADKSGAILAVSVTDKDTLLVNQLRNSVEPEEVSLDALITMIKDIEGV